MLRFAADRSEATLTLINHNISLSGYTSSKLEGQLSEIKQALLDKCHADLSSTDTSRHVVEVAPLEVWSQFSSTDNLNPPSWHPIRHFPMLATHSTSPPDTERYQPANELPATEYSDARRCPTTSNRLQTSYADHSSKVLRASTPFGFLERFPNYFPEIYTLNQRIPSSFIQVVNSYEQKTSSQCRTDLYELIYLKSPRQWRRLAITIETHQTSNYWILPKLRTSQYNSGLKATTPLPRTLYEQLRSRFSETEDIHDGSYHAFSLRDQALVEKEDFYQQIPLTTQRHLLEYLDDIGCPRYIENQVSQIAMTEVQGCFFSCVDGKFMLEAKISLGSPNLEILYNTQAFCVMKQTPGFARSTGIITDVSGSCLKSFVMGMPAKGSAHLFDLMEADRHIPWARREKWARQLVETIREVHSKNLVVGTLWLSKSSIMIDEFDCLHLWRFKNKFNPGYGAGLFYPPEFLYLEHTPPPKTVTDYPNITTKTDLFHLGIVFWHLAENVSRNPWTAPACVREGCDKQQSKSCWAVHKNPIRLPELSEEIPEYFRHIVNLCRAEDPNDRPPAWKLLEMFPSTGESYYTGRLDQRPEAIDLGYLKRTCRSPRYCDQCLENVQRTVFRCNVCRASNFHLCRACYDKDMHCSNKEHFLIELQLSPSSSWVVSGKYHSGVRLSGTRQVVEL